MTTLSKIPGQPSFACLYPPVLELCRAKKIYTLPVLWKRVSIAFEYTQTQRALAGFPPESSKGVSIEGLKSLITPQDNQGVGRVSPWDSGTKTWRPLARALNDALGSPGLQILFGAPGHFETMLSKAYAAPTPQRLHIRRLMRAAPNPFTRAQGITVDDIAAMASTDVLRDRNRLTRVFDADTDAHGKTHIRPFDQDGVAADWAIDLAQILGGVPVEKVFPYSAAKFRDRSTAARLPFDRAVPFEDRHDTRPDLQASSNPRQKMRDDDIRQIAYSLLVPDVDPKYPPSSFTEQRVHILEARILDGLSLDRTIKELGLTNNGSPITRQVMDRKTDRALRVLQNRVMTGRRAQPLRDVLDFK